MKQVRFSPALATIISTQLMVAPLQVHAQAPAQPSRPSVNQVISDGIGAVGQVIGAFRGAQGGGPPGGSPQFQSDMQALAQMQTPTPNEFFNTNRLSKIPGLMQYLQLNNKNPQILNCATLPTTAPEIYNPTCSIGVTQIQDEGLQSAQANEAFAYFNQYLQTRQVYENYSKNSNSGGEAFGIGCMNNAMEVLNGFFAYRLNEMDLLTAKLEDTVNNFKQQNAGVMAEIEGTTAILEGANAGPLANKVRTERPDLFEFGKRFDNPACKSILPINTINENGRSAGLNGITRTLKETYSQPSPNFSGESYLRNHAEVVRDMESVANQVAGQVTLNFSTLSDPSGRGYSEFLSGINGAISSTNPVNLSAGRFAQLQSSFKQKSDELNARTLAIGRELNGQANPIIGTLRDLNAQSFEQEVTNLENSLKNQCLAQAMTGSSSIDSIVGRVRDNSSSDFANEHAANEVKRRIREILSNNRTTLEQKQRDIAKLSTKGTGQMTIKTDAPITIQRPVDGRLVDHVQPAGLTTPSAYISLLIENCNNQFKYSQGTTMPQAQAVQNLRKIQQEYKSLASSHAQDLRKEVRRKLIECESPAVANNTVTGSCKPETFNTAGANFCANAALSCSKNMKQCTEQAQALTTQLKEKRTTNVQRYNAQAKNIKRMLDQHFAEARSIFDQAGVALRGEFGIGYDHPTNIQTDLPEGEQYNEALDQATQRAEDGSLLIEDPDKYLRLYRANVDVMKRSIQTQQEQVQQKLAEFIQETQKNYSDIISEIRTNENACKGKYEDYIRNRDQGQLAQAEQVGKQQSELGEKQGAFCRLYSRASANPRGACSGDIEDIIDGALGAANTAEARDAVLQFEAYCENHIPAESGGTQTSNWATLCRAAERDSTTTLLPDASIKKTIKDLCSSYRDKSAQCKPPAAGSTDSTASTASNSAVCREADNLEDEIVAEYGLFVSERVASGDGANLVLGDAPAFCVAGNNNDRSVPRTLLDGFLGGLQGPQPAGGFTQ